MGAEEEDRESEFYVCEPQRLKQLEDENRELTQANAHLREELEFLKMHPVLVAGLKGETLVCNLVKGKLTSFAESYDVTAGKCRIEVKYSNLGIPVQGHPTRRWSWSKPLGYKDKGGNYDYLVLIGDKDNRFPDQYLDTTPYVCFLIARKDVGELMYKGESIGGVIQLTTHFETVGNQQSKMLLSHMVKLEAILALIEPA
jgi:hypothetical protein